jgi:hypothetical protein
MTTMAMCMTAGWHMGSFFEQFALVPATEYAGFNESHVLEVLAECFQISERCCTPHSYQVRLQSLTFNASRMETGDISRYGVAIPR